jgi:ubiquinone/menaquinone biosynthesis C-methylase UbiE
LSIYKEFATIYATGEYPQFSQDVAKILPSLLESLDVSPKTLLDIACGEGTFAIAMAHHGLEVTGIDQSAEILAIAREKAQQAKLNITFHQMDMRKLNLSGSFNLITCWFDSLNYLLTINDVQSTFNGVAHRLNKKGLFVFDLNTIYWLRTLAERRAVTIERETDEVFQVHRHSFDEDSKIATFNFIAFIKENDYWVRRVDETHHERGYTLKEIRTCLKNAGLTEIACWGNLEERTPIISNTKRVWFVTKK